MSRLASRELLLENRRSVETTLGEDSDSGSLDSAPTPARCPLPAGYGKSAESCFLAEGRMSERPDLSTFYTKCIVPSTLLFCMTGSKSLEATPPETIPTRALTIPARDEPFPIGSAQKSCIEIPQLLN